MTVFSLLRPKSVFDLLYFLHVKAVRTCSLNLPTFILPMVGIILVPQGDELLTQVLNLAIRLFLNRLQQTLPLVYLLRPQLQLVLLLLHLHPQLLVFLFEVPHHTLVTAQLLE